MSEFESAEDMDLEKPDLSENHKGSVSPSCSICLEFVLDHGERSIAKLQCGHEFHLDCIGSAFNAKGTMQCPNCRKVEKGRWLYANGLRPSIDFDLDGLITEDIYDFSYSELPFGFQWWCPFGGFTGLTSLFEDSESQPNSYHEPLGSSTFGDHSSASTSMHVCPYLPLHHTMPFAPSNSSDSVPEIAPFHRHPTNLGGQPPAEMLNPYSFSANEAQNSHWMQQSLPTAMNNMAGNSDQGTSHNGPRLSRNDTSNQQRLGSFVHAHPLQHGSIPARSRSNLVASSMGPPVLGDIRALVRGHGNHVHQQSVSSSSSVQTSPFGPDRRSRPRGLTLISTSSSADLGFYGFSASGSISRGHQDADRHFDRVYWGREGFQPLPWIPHDGDSRWWGPFNPNQSPQPGNIPPRGSSTMGERVAQNRSESGYHQRMPLPNWMPPPPYM